MTMNVDALQNGLHQSKVREKAVAINDIAIRKVSQMKFDGFTEQENFLIWQYHKLLLRLAQELCHERKNIEYEYGIMLNLNTWEHIEIEGVRGGVYIDSCMEAKYALENGRKNSILYMHNHPSTGTFSATDIKTFLLNDAIFIMTAVGNNGVVYSIQKTRDSDIYGFLTKYFEAVEKYKKLGYRNDATLAIRDTLKVASKYGLIYKKGGHGL